MELTPPGQLLRRDFRPPGRLPLAGPTNTISLVQWNIERGYELEGIIEALRRLNADVIALQEVDVGCDRSGGADTGLSIAEALQLNYAFLCEFEELRSPQRAVRDQGGGVHGNCILSRFDIAEVEVVHHRHVPVEWNDATHPRARREPRRGRRAVLRATLAPPCGPPLVVYCAHLEVFCGMLARVAQLADIFADARRMADRGFPHQAILGDLNTMAHGIARLSPAYCCDRMRLLSLGSDEGVVWERHVLAVRDHRYDPSTARGWSGSTAAPPPPAEESEEEAAAAAAQQQAPPAPVNAQLRLWGLSEEVARDAVNPGFACPFPAASTVTLDNPRYRLMGRSLMRGKLDWALLRGLRVVGRSLGNDDFALSDHRWLAVEVRLDDKDR